jgi:hypothetical protein
MTRAPAPFFYAGDENDLQGFLLLRGFVGNKKTEGEIGLENNWDGGENYVT